MTDYDEEPPEKPVWVELWDPRLTRYAIWFATAAFSMWIIIQMLTP
jgi:hypothetical protein